MPASIDHRYLARLVGMARIVIGVAFILSPARAARGWIGAPATEQGGKVAVRALGIRDLVIGVGTVQAASSGDPALRRWVVSGGLCDMTDAAATVMAYRSLPKRSRALSLVVAAAGAALAFAARDHLD